VDRLPGGRRCRGLFRDGVPARDLDRDDRRADVDGLAFGREQGGDRPRVGAGQLDDRLRRLDLHDDLIDLNRVTRLDVPGHDVGLGEALPDVGEPELLVHTCLRGLRR
jgi:hypothetical protein